MIVLPKITIEHAPTHKDDPAPYRAHIVTPMSDHHGSGKTADEALLNAATHYAIYSAKRREADENVDEDGYPIERDKCAKRGFMTF